MSEGDSPPRCWRPVGLALLICALAWDCGPRSDSTQGGAAPVAVRLLDALRPADLVRPYDPADREQLREFGTSLLVAEQPGAGTKGRTWVFPRNAAMAFVGQRLDPASLIDPQDGRLLLPPFALLVHSLELAEPGPLQVRAALEGELFLAGVMELDQPPRLVSSADTVRLSRLLGDEGLVLGPSPDGQAHLSAALLPARAERHTLILAIQNHDAPLRVGPLELRRVSAVAAQLWHGGLSPSGHHLLLDRQAYECLLLPPLSRVSWEVKLPARDPELRFGRAVLGAKGPLTLRWTFRGLDHRSLQRSEVTLVESRGAWEDVSHGLGGPAGFAGHRVRITLEVEARQAEPGSVALALGAPVLVGRPPDATPRQPDVILVSLDTLRADRVGPGTPSSPRLTALEAESVVFTQALSTSSWTLPAHSSLFTGRWAQAHGATRQDRRLGDDGRARLARAFRDAGYRTVAITGGGYVSPAYGLAEGFEQFGVADPALPLRGHTEDRSSPARQRLMALLSGERRRPLFLFVHTFAVHNGKPLPGEAAALGLPADAADRVRRELLARGRADQPHEPDPVFEARVAAAYDASVLSGDALVGDMLDTLAASGRLDHCLLVVTSDHGQELFDHRAFGHGHQLHRELVSVPLIVRAPGVEPARIDQPVSLVDVAPTLRAWAGLPPDDLADGRSLLGALHGQEPEPVSLLAQLSRRDHPDWHLLRRGPLTLLASEQADGRCKPMGLYDLRTDPGEQHDLRGERSADAERLLAELHARLTELSRRAGAPAATMTLDADTRRQLAELGYLAGS